MICFRECVLVYYVVVVACPGGMGILSTKTLQGSPAHGSQPRKRLEVLHPLVVLLHAKIFEKDANLIAFAAVP